jgi:AMMECR1 domain-containing protein
MERELIEDHRPALCIGCEHLVYALVNKLTDPVGTCWRSRRFEEMEADEVLEDYKVECEYFRPLESTAKRDKND